MGKQPVFTGAGVALVTPMLPDGTVNHDKLRELVDRQIAGHTDAIIACATTGEAPTLSAQEHLEALRVVIEHTAGRVPVIAGTGSNDTAHAVMMSREAARMGADALLLVTPYYNKTSQRGLVAHYGTIAAATDLPLILYNVPSRTGVNILPETMAQMYRDIDTVVGIKQANGDLSSVAKLAALCDVPIYSGNDDQIVPILSLGGVGVISVLSNVVPQVVHDMCRRWFDGDVAGSRALQLDYLDLANALFLDVNPIPVKAAMNRMGLGVGECRLPLYRAEEKVLAALDDALRHHGLIGG